MRALGTGMRWRSNRRRAADHGARRSIPWGADATSGSLEAAANLSLRDAQPRMPDEPSMAPILVSSLAFAFVHWDYGPSWVPLFFFADVGLFVSADASPVAQRRADACLNGLSTLVMLSGGGAAAGRRPRCSL